MFPCISGLCVEYQSCHKFYDLGAHQDFCADSYGPKIALQAAEKQPRQWSRNWVFPTILTTEFASELNTKVVALQILLLLSKYEPIFIYVLGAMNFIVANSNSVLIIVCSFKFYFDPHLFFLHLRAIKFYHTNVMILILDGENNPRQSWWV